jgi:hypothetical protein
MKRLLIPLLILSLAACSRGPVAPATHVKNPQVEFLTSSLLSDTGSRNSTYARFTYFVVKAPEPPADPAIIDDLDIRYKTATCISRNKDGDLTGGVAIRLVQGKGGDVDFPVSDLNPGGTLTCSVDK